MIDLTIKKTLLAHLLKELAGPTVLNLSYVVKDLETQNHDFYSIALPVKDLESKLKFLEHWQATQPVTIVRVTVDLVSRGKK